MVKIPEKQAEDERPKLLGISSKQTSRSVSVGNIPTSRVESMIGKSIAEESDFDGKSMSESLLKKAGALSFKAQLDKM